MLWYSPGQKTFLLQGNLPNPGIKPRSPALQADSLPAEPKGKPICIKDNIFLAEEFLLTQTCLCLQKNMIRLGKNSPMLSLLSSAT